MRKPELSYFYCELYDVIYKHSNPSRIVNLDDASSLIGDAYNIPKVLRKFIIKEMEIVGWVERLSRYSIKLIHSPFNLKESPSKISRGLGIW